MTLRVEADLSKATKNGRKPTHNIVCFGQTLGVAWENPSAYTRFGVILNGMDGKLWLQKDGTVTYSIQMDDMTWKNFHKIGTYSGVDDHTLCFELDNILVNGEIKDIYGAGELVPLAQSKCEVEGEEDLRDTLKDVLSARVSN